ncbi:MAG: ferrous iron transport protein A [Peptococcaceae bacterium]|nr:ferrous iron transport protein A [Peptococcaceae bacterium]
MTLRELKVGQSGSVVAVGGEKALRRRLLEMGITPRTVITVKKVAPMGDPIELLLRGYVLTLRLEDAEKITVEELQHDLCACGQPKLRQDHSI